MTSVLGSTADFMAERIVVPVSLKEQLFSAPFAKEGD